MGRKKNKKPPMTADKKKSSYEVTTAKLLLATAIVEILEKLLEIVEAIIHKLE